MTNTSIHQKRFRFVWCFFCALILQGAPLNAGFKRLIKLDPPNNDISTCKTEIQKAISALVKTSPGNIEFECNKGIVSRLCVSTSTEIGANWQSFITKNATLFGIKKDEIRFHGENEQLWLTQMWKDVDIRNTGASIYRETRKNKTMSCISPRTIDTTHWTVDTKPTISSSTAANIVLKLWQKEAPTLTVEVDDVQLSVYLTTSGPRLIWAIIGAKSVMGDSYRIYCDIDAHTGLPPEAKYCTTSPDGQEI